MRASEVISTALIITLLLAAIGTLIAFEVSTFKVPAARVDERTKMASLLEGVWLCAENATLGYKCALTIDFGSLTSIRCNETHICIGGICVDYRNELSPISKVILECSRGLKASMIEILAEYNVENVTIKIQKVR